MRRGEIWWYEPPDAKRRPVLILTRDEAIERLFDLIAVPATGTIRRLPTEVELGLDEGMPIPCVLAVDNVFSAEKVYLTAPLTSLSSPKLREVCEALTRATGC